MVEESDTARQFRGGGWSLARQVACQLASVLPARWDRRRHVLMLSEVYRRGHGVPVVIAQHAACLVAAGMRVTIGGVLSGFDVESPGCKRVPLADARAAAAWSERHHVDVIVAHTPLFFAVAGHVGPRPAVIAYDYGEPPPGLFPDRERRERQLAEKDAHLRLSRRVYAISEAVAQESRVAVHGVIPLGNAHLGSWGHGEVRRRPGLRASRGWTDRFVVLDVCRFGSGERCYKGIDRFAETLRVMRDRCPDPERIVFVVAGKGMPEDIAALRSEGLEVVANPSDEDLHNLYVAADAYANFSRWEGYNLGIGQALSMGLPTIASDIPAHRAFGIPVFTAAEPAAEWLAACRRDPPVREPRITPWDASQRLFHAAMTDPDL